jgi:hypothetical protein
LQIDASRYAPSGGFSSSIARFHFCDKRPGLVLKLIKRFLKRKKVEKYFFLSHQKHTGKQ